MSTVEVVGGDVTIIAPERSHRPVGPLQQPDRKLWQLWRRPPACPFCPGQEALNIEVHREEHPSDSGSWILRVIKNKWPLHECHEVVIFSPDHKATLGGLSQQQLLRALQVLRDRVAHWHNRGVRVAVYINKGRLAGASQPHLHGQIVGLNDGQVVRFPRYNGDTMMPSQTEVFRVLVPRVPLRDWETLFEPLEQSPLWGASDAQLAALAAVLGPMLMLLEAQDEDMPYNVLFDPETCRVRVCGRKYTTAGFEESIGCRIIHIDPAIWAEQLRVVLAHP